MEVWFRFDFCWIISGVILKIQPFYFQGYLFNKKKGSKFEWFRQGKYFCFPFQNGFIRKGSLKCFGGVEQDRQQSFIEMHMFFHDYDLMRVGVQLFVHVYIVICLIYLSPRKLTWNVKISPLKKNSLPNLYVFEFHVSFGKLLATVSCYLRQPHFCCFRDTWKLILHHLLAKYVFFCSIFWTFSCWTMWKKPFVLPGNVWKPCDKDNRCGFPGSWGSFSFSLKVPGGPTSSFRWRYITYKPYNPFKKAL